MDQPERLAKKFGWMLLILLLVAGGVISHAAPAAEKDIEAKVKAAYLYHLTKFVDWPELPPNEVRICILGSEAVGSMMGDLANRMVRNRPLKIEVDDISDPAQCQVLFIGRSEKRLSELVKRLHGANVLTVSDLEDFARRGGMVGFFVDAGKLRLEINPGNARVGNLRISAKLLELARTVP